MGSGDPIRVQHHQQDNHDINRTGEAAVRAAAWKDSSCWSFRPFEAVGYARQRVREHKRAPKGETFVFMEISRNFLTGTVSMLLVKTREIVEM